MASLSHLNNITFARTYFWRIRSNKPYLEDSQDGAEEEAKRRTTISER